jgi:MFS family permease
MSGPSRSLLRHPDFLKLWTAETVSVFGSAITQLALPLIAATYLQVSPFQFALLTTIEFLPFILFSLPAGVWVDRLRRRPILIVADLGRAVAIASIPVAFYFDALTIWQLYIVGFVNGCFTVFFDVAYQSYLPAVVERDQLVDGNSKLEITRSAAQILGPGAAGILIGLLKAPFAMVLDSLSYLWSAAFVFWIRRPEPPVEPHDEAAHGPKPSVRQEIAVGLRYVTGHRWLRSIAATTGISNLFSSVIGAILILYLVDERDLGPAAIGIAFSIGSVGVLIAALTTSAATNRLGVGRMLVLTAIGFSIAGLPLVFAPDDLVFWAVAVWGFLSGFFGVAWNINQISLRQAITPARMQGKMNATMRFILWGTMPLGAILGGALGNLIGLYPTIVIGAVGGLVAFIPVTLSSVRHIVTMPEPVDDKGGAPPATGHAATA